MAKAATKKSTTKRAVAKTAATKKAASDKPAPAIRTQMTKAQLYTAMSEATGVAKKDVVAVMDELATLVERHIKKRGVGQFVMPGLFKIRTIRKKATKARPGRNPFTGEEIMIKAKPARTAVRITPLSKLKTMVED